MNRRRRFWQWIAEAADDLKTDRLEPAVENTNHPAVTRRIAGIFE